MKKILFISVDGEQIYLESLFLPILAPLNNKFQKLEIFQFCLDDEKLKSKLQNATLKKNIPIYFGKYFNSPPVIGSFLFIFYGALKLFLIVRNNKYTVLMPRSLVSGAMVLLIKPFFKNIKIIFETDGLVADERVDFGGWSKNGMIYKLFRKIEKKLINDSIAITTRTKKAKDILIERTSMRNKEKFFVIPNGKKILDMNLAEKDHHRNEIRTKLKIDRNDLVFIYVGSIGSQYEPENMIKVFNHVLQNINHAKMIILTPNQYEIKKVISQYPAVQTKIIIDTVSPHEVSQYIEASDIGFALRTPSFSQQAICPIKLIEYLMVGLPVISNSGVGDLDELYDKYDIGYIIHNLENINYHKIDEFINKVLSHDKKKNADNIKEIAKKEFDLNHVIEKYNAMFDKVLNADTI